MFQRPVLLVSLLAAAVGVPYLLLDKNLSETARGQWRRLSGSLSATPAATSENASKSGIETPAALTVPQVSIEEAFRFDVRPEWVASRFKSVSTVTDSKQLGMRVALVSGTRPDDVAGSLTYYFDEYHQPQRITFTGQSGDARRLLAAVVGPYGLKSLPTTDAARYVAGNPKQPTSQVVVKYLPQLQGSPTSPRNEIALDLRRTDAIGWEQRQVQAGEASLLPPSYRQW
ncbi:MAG TPA: DUF6690 family protein [Pirellulaceae bacterium]|nr:DUF6690 family protein [Pirellulaceae bacterium]